MPYTYRRRLRFRRRRRTTKPKNATARAVKNAKYRKSARAQQKQIRTIGKALTVVQKNLRENQNVDMKWKFAITNQRMINSTPAQQGNILCIPLVSGPTNDPLVGARSSLVGQTGTPDCGWSAVQPKGKSTQDARGSFPWCRLYRANYKLCIHSNTLRKPVRYTMFVVRLARDDETDNDNTMLQRLSQIDGVANTGHPDSQQEFARDEDYYSIQGFDNPVLQGSTVQQGITQSDGHLQVQMNNSRFKVVHKRECVVGMNTVSSANLPSTTSPSQVVQAFVPAGAASHNNQSYYETSFSLSFGGAKCQPSNIDGAGTAADPITISDLSYADINPKLKHWLLIFPSTTTTFPDPNPLSNEATGIAVMSLEGTCSSKVPA